jgi:hypothetical protein
MKYKVTARWIGCSLPAISPSPVDIAELNHKYYVLATSAMSNEHLGFEENLPAEVEQSTIEGIRESGDQAQVLRIIENRNPDWIYIQPKCECGADKVYGSLNTCHDHWCPKYGGI